MELRIHLEGRGKRYQTKAAQRQWGKHQNCKSLIHYKSVRETHFIAACQRARYQSQKLFLFNFFCWSIANDWPLNPLTTARLGWPLEYVRSESGGEYAQKSIFTTHPYAHFYNVPHQRDKPCAREKIKRGGGTVEAQGTISADLKQVRCIAFKAHAGRKRFFAVKECYVGDKEPGVPWNLSHDLINPTPKRNVIHTEPTFILNIERENER